MFSDFFPKDRDVCDKMRKIWWSQRGHKWHHSMAHTHCMLDKQGYMHTPMRSGTDTQTNVSYLLLFYGSNDSRTCLNVTLYICCLSCSVITHKLMSGIWLHGDGGDLKSWISRWYTFMSTNSVNKGVLRSLASVNCALRTLVKVMPCSKNIH
jgi:hypothetical protein